MSSDILPLFTAVLRDAGLEVKTVEADGRLHPAALRAIRGERPGPTRRTSTPRPASGG